MPDQMDHPETAAENASFHDLLHELLQDHAMVRAALAAMEGAARQERAGEPIQRAFWLAVLDFFAGYYDRVHHPKEDGLLLPILASSGFDVPGSAVRIMMQEHDRMQPYREHLANAIELGSATDLRATVQAFVALHRQHMQLEEQHVFPMVRSVLPASVQQELTAALLAFDAAHADERRRAQALVDAITRQAAAVQRRGEAG